MWARADFAANLAAIVDDGKARAPGVVKPYAAKGKEKYQLPDGVSAAEAASLLEAELMGGTSFVLAFEKVSEQRRPMKWLADALFAVTVIPASIHLYASAPGAQVLPPHTDPYDVLVWQLTGTKNWRACVPREELASRTFNVSRPLSDSQRCLLQELVRGNIEGCNTYSVDDAATSLSCEDFVMAPGDVLYMPKGVVHFAQTVDTGDITFHLTIGLHRKRMQWLDVIDHMIEHLPPPAAADADATADGGSGAGGADGTGGLQREAFRQLVDRYSQTAEGVHLHESVPGWLLHCLRPAALVHAHFEGAPSCTEREAELLRVFRLHMERLGNWLYQLARRGAWQFASEVATREAKPGQAADMEAVRLLFWWRGFSTAQQPEGGLAILSALAAGGDRLQQALASVAKVLTWEDTEVKAAEATRLDAQMTRRAGGVRRGGPSLCDEMDGWDAECRNSDATLCEAHVKTAKPHETCAQYCEAQGMWCEAAWDDASGGCKRQSSGKAPLCNVKRTNQICACRRDCMDRGPWACTETGCPARQVTCEILSAACSSTFNRIWNTAPADVAELQVWQVCPMSCGRCLSQPRASHAQPKEELPAFVHAKVVTVGASLGHL